MRWHAPQDFKWGHVVVVSRRENARVGGAESTKVIVCATKRDILSHPRLLYLHNCVNYKTGIAWERDKGSLHTQVVA